MNYKLLSKPKYIFRSFITNKEYNNIDEMKNDHKNLNFIESIKTFYDSNIIHWYLKPVKNNISKNRKVFSNNG